jgi:hypothetical protein
LGIVVNAQNKKVFYLCRKSIKQRLLAVIALDASARDKGTPRKDHLARRLDEPKLTGGSKHINQLTEYLWVCLNYDARIIPYFGGKVRGEVKALFRGGGAGVPLQGRRKGRRCRLMISPSLGSSGPINEGDALPCG